MSQPDHVSSLDPNLGSTGCFCSPDEDDGKDGTGPSYLHPPAFLFSKGLPPPPACTPHRKRSHSSCVVGLQILQFVLGQTFCSLSCKLVDGKISCLVGDKKEGGCVAKRFGLLNSEPKYEVF